MDAIDYSLLAPDQSDADDADCRDTERLTGWLADQCMDAKVVPWQPVLRAESIGRDTATPTLLALAFDSGQPPDTRLAAMRELRARYLAYSAAGRLMGESIEQQADFDPPDAPDDNDAHAADCAADEYQRDLDRTATQ